MGHIEQIAARLAKQMTRQEVILKAIEGRLKWYQAASILGITDRQMRRIKERYEREGYSGVQDRRGKRPRRKRISVEVVDQVLTLRRAYYADFSIAHFHEFLRQKHGLTLSEKWTRLLLQKAGLAEKAPARGKFRRRRERRPMRGMLLHLDASTHKWLQGQPTYDLLAVIDDADGRLLYARLEPQESTMTSLRAIRDVVVRYGRFCELYTDRGSHFCTTTRAEAGPNVVQNGQIPRALKALGIRHIRARSPQARGRSERAFRTIQGRLPQELRLAGITDYAAANAYLEKIFMPKFNENFTVEPAESDSAFTRLDGLAVDLPLSVQHERIVQPDNTVSFRGMTLQLRHSTTRIHYVRCPVTVHEFTDTSLGVTYTGHLLGLYDQDGQDISGKDLRKSDRKRAA